MAHVGFAGDKLSMIGDLLQQTPQRKHILTTIQEFANGKYLCRNIPLIQEMCQQPTLGRERLISALTCRRKKPIFHVQKDHCEELLLNCVRLPFPKFIPRKPFITFLSIGFEFLSVNYITLIDWCLIAELGTFRLTGHEHSFAQINLSSREASLRFMLRALRRSSNSPQRSGDQGIRHSWQTEFEINVVPASELPIIRQVNSQFQTGMRFAVRRIVSRNV